MFKTALCVGVFIFGMLALAACSGPTQATPVYIPVVVTVEVPSQAQLPATPVFIPVIVTVEVPVTVIVHPTPSPVSTPSPTTVFTQTENLEEDARLWDVYREGSPTWIMDNADTPAIEGKSLRCSITGGAPYSNVHCYQNLPSEPDVNTFALGLTFQFTPTTTCNDQETASIVQAIEFTMNKWYQSQRYEFALQWQNVGPGASQWRYWDPSRPDSERWVPITPAVTACLEGGQWHTLHLDGRIIEGQAHYQAFTIDGMPYDLDLRVPAASVAGEPDRLAIAVQVDGNASASPYDVFIDRVSFVRQVDCRLVTTAEITQPNDGDIVKPDTKIVWFPACPMVLQFYQNDNPTPLVDEIADSGQWDFSTLPPGRTEIKIWIPSYASEGIPADSVSVTVR